VESQDGHLTSRVALQRQSVQVRNKGPPSPAECRRAAKTQREIPASECLDGKMDGAGGECGKAFAQRGTDFSKEKMLSDDLS